MNDTATVFKTFRFEHDGAVWEMDRPDLATERAYAKHLEARAIDGVNRHRARLGDFGYRSAIESITRDFSRGTYAWMSPAFIESLQDPENAQQLLVYWFTQPPLEGSRRPSNPPIDERGMASLWRARKADLDNLLWEVLSDPNRS